MRARWNIGAHGLSQDELSQRFACALCVRFITVVWQVLLL
ncbi:hypothetical protein K788_0007812 [Paraburkholderia caribensis MBA4]|uniref:Uncharacterized protein n=1 Tax=Paraburkholderia caribensis MBA4 TaxID=1323664 RepID=A0A0P0R8F1_9BURK|nr:hypothetical protein K788_0007812 [Paraburkholderia caribensis MBA4]